jgi:outer membrane protein assembly factor BamB
VRKLGEGTFLVREGALPGSANWTHEHADAANTRVSRDTLVKAPLGLLWFGGASNDAILPRHGHGPQPQVVDGRLYIEGLDILRATDIYTGRMLWEARLPGLGKLYNNTAHQPGANAIGTNYIATPEGIYVAYGANCLRLDPATGEQLSAFTLPLPREGTTAPEWSYINVAGDYLIGGSEGLIEAGFGKITGDNDNFSSSKHLTALDRESGKLLWSITAENGFRHNAICIGGGRLYCIDRLSGAQLDRLKRRGAKPKTEPRLSAFDLKSGKVVWTTSEKVFGTWLSYAAEHDVLVESGRAARDTLSDEPKGMRAFAAKTGEELWFNSKHVGPAMIHRDTVLMAGNACDLLTGALRMREHPLTGEPVEWCWSRNYGCNTPMASEHLLTFRSGAAGYFDYSNDGGTGNFGGFRSSCTNNLVVAGGVLSAPDYTRTCTCNYQNQTSLALVPMPEVETWTSFGDQNFKQPIRRLGINLGAPGDRKDASGTLWIDYPSVGGDSPEVEIVVSPKEPAWFRRHSSQVQGDGLAWVAASGAEGIISLKVTIGDKKSAARIYTVRLHFVEPQPLNVGDRTFDIRLQGERVSSAFDIIKEAGGVLRPVVKEFHGVECRDVLTVELSPQAKARGAAVLCGVEILAEGW